MNQDVDTMNFLFDSFTHILPLIYKRHIALMDKIEKIIPLFYNVHDTEEKEYMTCVECLEKICDIEIPIPFHKSLSKYSSNFSLFFEILNKKEQNYKKMKGLLCNSFSSSNKYSIENTTFPEDYQKKLNEMQQVSPNTIVLLNDLIYYISIFIVLEYLNHAISVFNQMNQFDNLDLIEWVQNKQNPFATNFYQIQIVYFSTIDIALYSMNFLVPIKLSINLTDMVNTFLYNHLFTDEPSNSEQRWVASLILNYENYDSTMNSLNFWNQLLFMNIPYNETLDKTINYMIGRVCNVSLNWIFIYSLIFNYHYITEYNLTRTSYNRKAITHIDRILNTHEKYLKNRKLYTDKINYEMNVDEIQTQIQSSFEEIKKHRQTIQLRLANMYNDFMLTFYFE